MNNVEANVYPDNSHRCTTQSKLTRSLNQTPLQNFHEYFMEIQASEEQRGGGKGLSNGRLRVIAKTIILCSV